MWCNLLKSSYGRVANILTEDAKGYTFIYKDDYWFT